MSDKESTLGAGPAALSANRNARFRPASRAGKGRSYNQSAPGRWGDGRAEEGVSTNGRGVRRERGGDNAGGVPAASREFGDGGGAAAVVSGGGRPLGPRCEPRILSVLPKPPRSPAAGAGLPHPGGVSGGRGRGTPEVARRDDLRAWRAPGALWGDPFLREHRAWGPLLHSGVGSGCLPGCKRDVTVSPDIARYPQTPPPLDPRRAEPPHSGC